MQQAGEPAIWRAGGAGLSGVGRQQGGHGERAGGWAGGAGAGSFTCPPPPPLHARRCSRTRASSTPAPPSPASSLPSCWARLTRGCARCQPPRRWPSSKATIWRTCSARTTCAPAPRCRVGVGWGGVAGPAPALWPTRLTRLPARLLCTREQLSKATPPFKYFHKGSLAYVGSGARVLRCVAVRCVAGSSPHLAPPLLAARRPRRDGRAADRPHHGAVCGAGLARV